MRFAIYQPFCLGLHWETRMGFILYLSNLKYSLKIEATTMYPVDKQIPNHNCSSRFAR